MTDAKKVVRRCVSGSHSGEDVRCGPGDYVRLRHRDDPERYERYEIRADELHYLYDVDKAGLPLTDTNRKDAGYEPLRKPKKRGKRK